MKRMAALLLCAFLLCGTLTACKKQTDTGSADKETAVSFADTDAMDFSVSDEDAAGEYDTAKATDLSDAEMTITGAGTYVLSGEKDAAVTVAAGENDKVQLVLDNVTINVKDGPAIYIRSADKVTITVKDGTENTVSDGDNYTVTDGDTTVDAAIFSKADLTVNGGGKLTVNGNCKHAIVSKDDLIITAGTLDVKAKNVGLNGKDCVKISGGAVTVDAGSDGIRSDNTEDTDRGYVYIEGGTLAITAGNDGIQAETALKADNATVTVKAGAGSGQSLSSYDSESYKGIKAGSDILLSGGTYTVSSQDDCIHSNNTVSITGGIFSLASGDDGIHADTDLAVSGGNITISQSYEGLEGSRILISGGNINVTASDDGLNAAGGNDSSGMGNRPGMGGFSSSTGEIEISGGYTLVNAEGDGIDSNGTITVSGGITLVSGPTNSGNGAFDYDGSAAVTGGILIAVGSSGMAQGFTSAENQGAIFCSLNAQSGGTSFAVCDASGNAVVSFTPEKAYSSVAVTAPGIKQGETYTLVVGGTVSGADTNGYAENAALSGGDTLLEIEMTSTLYSAGGGGHGGGGMGGHGGFGRPW